MGQLILNRFFMGNAKKKSLGNITRILSIVCAIGLFVVIFIPIWKIELSAPQYPEGLELQIYADKLAGQVEIINGLNNYIGMRELYEDDFVEFKVLPYIIGFIALMGIIVAIANRKWLFFTWVGTYILFAIVAMIDFYIWLYDYGHNLDPKAPIKLEGMTYMPPLFGEKDLLNFYVKSYPHWGTILMTLSIVFSFFAFLKSPKK